MTLTVDAASAIRRGLDHGKPDCPVRRCLTAPTRSSNCPSLQRKSSVRGIMWRRISAPIGRSGPSDGWPKQKSKPARNSAIDPIYDAERTLAISQRALPVRQLDQLRSRFVGGKTSDEKARIHHIPALPRIAGPTPSMSPERLRRARPSKLTLGSRSPAEALAPFPADVALGERRSAGVRLAGRRHDAGRSNEFHQMVD